MPRQRTAEDHADVPAVVDAPVTGAHHDGAAVGPSTQEMPRVRFTRRQVLVSALFVASALAFLYLVLPKLLGLQQTWNRLQQGNIWWLALAAVFSGEFQRSPLLFWMAIGYMALLPLEVRLAIL